MQVHQEAADPAAFFTRKVTLNGCFESSRAWLHWKEEDSLIQWHGNLSKRTREASPMDDSDAVKWGRNTYEEGDRAAMFPHTLSTRAWKQLAADCEEPGEKYVFEPVGGGR